jgi:hypothetical protein
LQARDRDRVERYARFDRGRRKIARMGDGASVWRKVVVVSVIAWAGACSSPSGSTGAPSDLSPTAKSRLADYCAKRDACQTETGISSAPCPTSMCLASQTVEGPLLEYFDCQIAKQCSAFFNDDDCAASAGTPDAEQTQFVSRCIAKNTECSGDFDSFCGVGGMPIIRKDWLHMFDACISKACADIDACLNAVLVADCWH